MKDVIILNKEIINSAIDKINNAVVSTLGPKGSNTIISSTYPIVTKDGVTIVKNIGSKNAVENAIMQLIGESSIAVSNRVGDGTTSAAAIACSTIRYFLEKDMWPINGQVRYDVEAKINDIEKALRKKAIKNDKVYRYVANVSSNNDKEISELSLSAFKKAGQFGMTYVDFSETTESYIVESDGYRLSKGLSHIGFVQETRSFSALFDDPIVIVGTKPIDNIDEISTIFDEAKGRPVIIFSNAIAIDVLTILVENVKRNNIRCAVIGIPGTGKTVDEFAMDIANTLNIPFVGHELVTTYKESFREHKDAYLNCNAKRIISNLYSTTIMYKDKEIAKKVSDDIRARIQIAEKNERDELKYRASSIIGKIITVKVGGNTGTARNEKVDRIDDTLHALQSVRQHGALLGGGISIYEYDFPPLRIITDTIKSNLGIETINEYTDYLLKNNIFDPTMAVIESMRAGISAALNILSSKSIIIDVKE